MSIIEISEINKYCDPYSILIVTNKRKLVRLKCPFPVQVIKASQLLKINDILIVDSVKIDLNFELIYIINLIPYPYSFFKIMY